jgi:hypothetical protein
MQKYQSKHTHVTHAPVSQDKPFCVPELGFLYLTIYLVAHFILAPMEMPHYFIKAALYSLVWLFILNLDLSFMDIHISFGIITIIIIIL